MQTDRNFLFQSFFRNKYILTKTCVSSIVKVVSFILSFWIKAKDDRGEPFLCHFNFLFYASILAYKTKIYMHSNVAVIAFIHRNFYIAVNLLLFSTTAPHWLLHQFNQSSSNIATSSWPLFFTCLLCHSALSVELRLILSHVCHICSCLFLFTYQSELCIGMLFTLLGRFMLFCFVLFSASTN